VFLNHGEPPVVFTLGSFAVFAPGAFYEHSAEACRRMGLRAIFLTGRSENAQTTDTTLTRAYLPHSLVFSRCAAIVHHGGIGTTGQAMIAGRPQVVVPHMGDQWDNGYRLERLGVATVLPAQDYTAESARRAIADILGNTAFSERAKNVANDVRVESGASTAAELILSALQ
jgi:rhamnosyltransferase subunit B